VPELAAAAFSVDAVNAGRFGVERVTDTSDIHLVLFVLWIFERAGTLRQAPSGLP